MAVAKEQIRQIISENNISSVADVYTLPKDSFKDILQELMEAELDATLGYEKNHKGDLQTDNKRNGHSTKNLKSQYGELFLTCRNDPVMICLHVRDLLCILSLSYRKKKVSANPPDKTCSLRPNP